MPTLTLVANPSFPANSVKELIALAKASPGKISYGTTGVGNVTHLGRSVTQQVALWWQSPMCTREGCTRTQLLENDHREDWVKTHHTRLDETDPFCDHHHDLKTLHGWALVEGTGPRPMVPPNVPRHPKNRPRP